MDVIVADLDGGSITVPDGVSLPLLPEAHARITESVFAA
jgi:hypothetical protein